MAIQYRLSDVLAVHIVEEKGERILELQTKYVRYQLIIDNEARRQDIIDALSQIPQRQPEPKKEVRLPPFTKLS
jgi:ribosomal protein L23